MKIFLIILGALWMADGVGSFMLTPTPQGAFTAAVRLAGGACLWGLAALLYSLKAIREVLSDIRDARNQVAPGSAADVDWRTGMPRERV